MVAAMIGLCATCRRAVFRAGEIDSLIPGLPVQAEWAHFVLPPRGEEHEPMAMPGVRDRMLSCARCGRPQGRDSNGWFCPSPSCQQGEGNGS